MHSAGRGLGCPVSFLANSAQVDREARRTTEVLAARAGDLGTLNALPVGFVAEAVLGIMACVLSATVPEAVAMVARHGCAPAESTWCGQAQRD